MAKDNYQKALERHLADYKEQRLGVREKGTFIHRGVERQYRHILPRSLQWLNIPEPFRMEVQAFVVEHRHIKLHKYFHHLNSSQALALAVFVPYLTQAPGALMRAMMCLPAPQEWDLECVPDSSEGTNVDVWWRSAGAETYCEVKLSEREFGPAPDDARHRRKLESIYGPVLRRQVDDALLEPKAFFANYQILRNLWLAARPGQERDRVVFLFPKANTGVAAQLDAVLRKVNPGLRSRVAVVHVEPLLEKLAADRSDGGLGWYARLLQEKYVPA